MRILVIGSGGREHAIVRALSHDSAVTELHAAPGNPGIAQLARLHEVNATDPADVTRLARYVKADLVVIGPEAPLVAGVADALRAEKIDVFGPDAAAARIEGSKAYSKQVMAAAGIPTARSVTADTAADTEEALSSFGPPYVVKDDALAAGKGVVVTDDLKTARSHAASCKRVVIEEYLDGPEVSLFALADGTTAVPLLPAQDFKRARDGDEGPNTGGMGAYCPLPWAPANLTGEVMDTVIQPAIDELARRGTPYKGLLYAGLALTGKGVRVVEFNARFGDPETQVILDRLATPLAGLLRAAATGDLAAAPALSWHPGAAVTVVLAAEGYPANPVKGDTIYYPERIGASLLHAGTALQPTPQRATAQQATPQRATAQRHESAVDMPLATSTALSSGAGGAGAGGAGAGGGAGRLVSAGGRVLNALGSGPDLAAARAAAYEVIGQVEMRGGWYRRDIAARATAGKS